VKYVGFVKNAIGDLIDMYNYADIRSIHLEVTQNCQANCPMCDRNMNGEGINPHINLDELSLEDCKKIFLPEFIEQLDTMYMCGNLGDPIVAKDTLEIFKYFREHNPNIWLSMNTNAGAKSVKWWAELADVINKKGAVIFSVDGLRDTNHLYRQGVNWNNVERNMQAFINGGGRARWDFLIFEHNQHQVEEAEALANKWGCEKFMKKKTGRFITQDSKKKESHQALDKKGNTTTEIKKPDAKYVNKALSKQEVIINKYGTMDAYYDAAPIICKVKKDNSLFITAEGLAMPCCWTAGRMYKWWHKDPKVEQIWDFIDKDALDARNGLEQVFATGVFDRIQDSWNKPSCGDGKLKVCAMKCGAEFDPFGEQFK
jgi:MoaA/NifB/PqqE/SkfB family radical SAM enzyme